MPHHVCIDPNDQYAQAEAMVEFEATAGVVRLISVRDALDEDILPDLEEVQCQALEREILDDFQHLAPTPDGLRRRGPIMENHGEGSA